MTIAEQMLAAALSWTTVWYPPGEDPETQCEYEERVETIVTAVELETVKPPDNWAWSVTDLAWAALVVMYAESKFALDVHRGTRRGDQGRSWCLGQIMHGGRHLAGTDLAATRRCARAVVSHLAHHQNRCVPNAKAVAWTMSAVYVGYGTGHSCSPRKRKWAQRRGYMWARYAQRDHDDS